MLRAAEKPTAVSTGLASVADELLLCDEQEAARRSCCAPFAPAVQAGNEALLASGVSHGHGHGSRSDSEVERGGLLGPVLAALFTVSGVGALAAKLRENTDAVVASWVFLVRQRWRGPSVTPRLSPRPTPSCWRA